MALVVKDRVKEVTTTTGTADLTLGGAVYGFQSFAIIGNGNTTYYAIYDSATGDWEVGIGTYTTAGPTLTRTTVFESSNSGSKVVFGAGTKDVFVTYPAERAVYLDAAGSAVTLLDVGTLGVGTANITTANITAGTISTTPTNNTDIVNKQYADAIASGIHFHEAVGYATTAALPAVTYNNGTGGVGATLTANANGALTVDGYTFVSPADNGTRILIKNQADGAQNGVYTLTQAGNSSPGAPFILTRATDFDSVGTGVDQIDEGDFFLVTGGTANANTAWVQQTPPPITIGTTAIVFQQFSAPITYTAGTGLSESPSYTFNIANIGTAGTYGTASQVPVFVTNAQGQVTSVTNTGIAISAGAVSGLAASATTDTTNASNITSGTLPVARLSGSYTGITGVGTLAAGTWNASTIGVAYGGTGITSYTVGDLLYADGATSLAKLADVATGNALISGGVGTAPAWGKIGLQTHVSGTLQLVNGGTGATDASGARSNLGLVIGTDIPSVTGSGASGTWNINITGNAATATTSTTSTTATQVSNSVTFNNSGAGAASGNGFNGSGALTVSYNTIGAPSTTGTNASGTWGISISGNAATATNSTTTSQRNFSGDVSTTGQGRFTGWYSGNAATGQAVEVGMSSGEGYIIVYDRNTSTYGTLNLQSSGASLRLTGSTVNVATGALQQGGNQVLHAGNYNSYAPTLTGGGASGTWGINITGSAGSAGSVDYNNLTNKTGGTGTYTTSGDYRAPIFYDSDNTGYYVDPASTSVLNSAYVFTTFLRRVSTTQSGISWYSPSYTAWSNYMSPAGAGGSGPTGNITAPSGTYVTSWALRSFIENAGGYGWTFESGTSSGQPSVVAEIRASDGLAKFNGGTYSPIFYDSDNTGYYVDPASTSVLNQTNIAYNNGNFEFASNDNSSTSYSVAAIEIRETNRGGSSGYLAPRLAFHWGGVVASQIGIEGSGRISILNNPGSGYENLVGSILYGSASVRAPIFYDSDNTGYYLDPASTSELNKVYYNSNMVSRNYGIGQVGLYDSFRYQAVFSMGESYILPANGTGTGNLYGIAWSHPNAGGVASNLASHGMLILENGGFYGAWGGGRLVTTSDIRGTIFYDYNNTGYYCDPASTSYLYSLQLSGAAYFRPNNWIELNGDYGLYSAVYNSAHLLANISSSYGQWRIIGSRNGWAGIYDTFSAVNGIMYDGSGNGGVYREANGRWYLYYHLGNDCLGVGTSSTSSTYSLYLNKGVYAQSRIDATIFYDTNNTGYYADPASTSNFVGLTVANTISGSINGNAATATTATTANALNTGNNYQVNSLGVGTAASGTAGEIRATNNVTAYYSDDRLKNRLGPIEDALAKVLSLEGFYYEANELAQSLGYVPVREVGLSAQQTQRVLPEVVVPAPIDDRYLTMRYERVIPLLVEAIKELSAKVDALH